MYIYDSTEEFLYRIVENSRTLLQVLDVEQETGIESLRGYQVGSQKSNKQTCLCRVSTTEKRFLIPRLVHYIKAENMSASKKGEDFEITKEVSHKSDSFAVFEVWLNSLVIDNCCSASVAGITLY